MAMLEDLATHIASTVSATLGADLFIANMPDEPGMPATVACLYETAGRVPLDTFGAGPPTIERPGVQVRVRGPNWPTARGKLQSYINALHSIVNQTVGSSHYIRVAASGSAGTLGPDSQGRIHLIANFAVDRVP